MFEIKIIRQNRKTLSLVLCSDGTVEARAPKRLDTDIILKFVEEKRDWIEQKLLEINAKKGVTHTYLEGDKFEFLGKRYTLVFYDGTKIVLREDKLMCPKSFVSCVKNKLGGWYKVQAKTVLKKFLDQESERLGISYGGFRISTAHKRWGSCNAENDIALNYRLVSAPEYVIRAVCVHELCHVQHKNHGKDFKRLLRECEPELKKAEDWLKSRFIEGVGE